MTNDRERQLIAAIQDIWDKATPYGGGFEEGGEMWIDKYLLPAGPLHRAKGLLVSLSSVPQMDDAIAAGLLYANRWKLYITGEPQMQNAITDEMAKQVWDIWVEKSMDPTMTNLDCVCAVLLAVAPRLRAEGMKEAYQMAVSGRDCGYTLDYLMAAIFARAAELEKAAS
jgi:hypothetical protein